jgi:hypothetical protein
MIRVTAVSHHLHAVHDGEALPSLDEALKPLSREHFRRIDRFIQLSLLGSARCVAGRSLTADCGLYLGSGHGPVGNNISTQEQLIRDHRLPKPFNFVNTLGNSAGYYVAKNLGLSGQNLFISRRGASFQAVLDAAWVDMESGALRQALVGVVEEVTLPLTEHRRRQGLAPDTLVAEGSHWLLLEKDAAVGHSMERSHASHHEAQPRPAVFHDSIAAAEVTERLVKGEAASLADGDTVRGWELFHFRP